MSLRPAPPPRRAFRSSWPAAVLAAALGLLAAVAAQADPVYRGPVLYGLDPVVRATDDPRLLGEERLLLLRRLRGLGVDPWQRPGVRPSMATILRRRWQERANVDLTRQETVVEYNGETGLATRIQYPTYFYLYPARQTLPGGIAYTPPRPLGDPVVRLFVDDLEGSAARTRAVDRRYARTAALDLAAGGRRTGTDEGLLNLTIPIKLPRTLEKIIGRGEKTRIKITGREHISIGGETTVNKPFIPTETISSPSYFPNLDMEQELQVNLSGVIGEKIIIEVDHNSAAIGPEATKIKLMYQGLEDEIINTIEAGDVGMTLPGSNLMGYSSNKSGLFGVKVTGQVGRADFTFVASKQKAESSSKTFNARGGAVEDNVIYSYQYLNNRFFRLDLPNQDSDGRVPFIQVAGEIKPNEIIDPESIHVYRAATGLPTDYVSNIAVYLDKTGRWAGDFDAVYTDPSQIFARYDQAQRWVEVPWTGYTDADNNLVGVDLGQQMAAEDILAVVYRIKNVNTGVFTYVGDVPGSDPAEQVIPGQTEPFYRMKLLKAPGNKKEPYTYQYVLRNVYPLGGAGIEPESFDLRIEREDASTNIPEQDEQGVQYIRIFGLDSKNPQGGSIPDGVVDKTDRLLFDLDRGLLKFPLDFATPFADANAHYTQFVNDATWSYDASTFLNSNQVPDLYDANTLQSNLYQYGKFKIIASHASAASSFSLGASNIEEGSETVTLDGTVLTRDQDYEIDYIFGQITLKGDAANLTASSQISVKYSFAPFVGGGKTNLVGFNLGYDLGRDSQLSTTWLYQTEQIVGEKAKLGEEPSKNLVGNINLQHTFKPYFLTHVANFLSRRNTERESSVQFSGEMALSLPDPNTKGKVYLEDFEGVDSSDLITLVRTGWARSSAPPLIDEEGREFTAENRVEAVRWFLPRSRVLRRYLNPELDGQERDETQSTMDLYLRSDDGVWDATDWGGIMRGLSRTGMDLSKSQFLELWINDNEPDLDQRSGRLHIDFGYVSEDGFWPVGEGGAPQTGTWQQEDGITNTERDGILSYEEDIGLGGDENGAERYSAEYEVNGDQPYPFINGTARNNILDTEDLNGNGDLDLEEGYFTTVIDLRETEALVDVVYDYASSRPNDVADLVAADIAWRKYRIRLGDLVEVIPLTGGVQPDLQSVTHIRVWYENDDAAAKPTIRLQLSDLKFLGSRWEREGVRRAADEVLLSSGERLSGEEFFLGEVNNKENPDYIQDPPPFSVHTENGIKDKEQSLSLVFENLEPGHLVRASKQVSLRGDDYTRYEDLSWYWYNAGAAAADLNTFFRVGTDTLNYYEIGYRFSDSDAKTGWKYLRISVADLSNVKNGTFDPLTSHVTGTVTDTRTGDEYPVRVVGRPDLRTVRRYYMGVVNDRLSEPVSGKLYLNDIKLEGVKKDKGMAQSAGVRLNMADLIKADFNWSHRDAEFHGLDTKVGSGTKSEDWSFSANLNVDDFIPLLGFQLPLNVGRGQKVQRPKYEINSDIEILDQAVQNRLSTIETSERFTTQVRRQPSSAALLRYLVDPWRVTLNGSRSWRSSPLDRRHQKTLSGSLSYDLRIAGRYRLGDYPGFKYVPILRGLSLVPQKVALGASFNSSYTTSKVIDADGTVTPRPTSITRPGKLTAGLDYQPLTVLSLSVNAASDRDLLRERRLHGLNIGQENKRSYDLRLTVTPPQAKELPQTRLLAPVRLAAKGLAKLRPSLQFTGSFSDVHDPLMRQAGDPGDIRSISNAGNWEFRFNFPLGDLVKELIPERRFSAQQQEQMIREQRRREEQVLRGGKTAEPDISTTTGGDSPADVAGLTPQEIQRLEEERLLREAEERLASDRERGVGVPAAGPEPEAEAAGAEGGRRFRLPNPLTPLLNTLRNTQPLKVTITDRKTSSYARIQERANFWYMTGLEPESDTDPELYTASNITNQNSLSVATTSQVMRTVSLDVKFSHSTSLRNQLNSETESYQQDWPDAQLSFSGIEKLGLFGRKADDPESGWFRSSNINVSYKHTKSVNNMTATTYNPKYTSSWSPRWTFNFHSGMSATLTSTLANDRAISNGIITKTGKLRFGLQLRHQFRAQGILAKLGLYRPGTKPTINMDVDLSYQNNRTERINPGSTNPVPTGTTQYSMTPRFTYQVNRNLTLAMRMKYAHSKNIATNTSSTTVGLGLEGTFAF